MIPLLCLYKPKTKTMSETTQEQKVPTTEEFIAHINEQISIAEVRAKLQALNTQIAKDRAEELNALMFIAQVTNPKASAEEGDGEEPSEDVLPKRKLKKD
jgi:hypothetical protein